MYLRNLAAAFFASSSLVATKGSPFPARAMPSMRKRFTLERCEREKVRFAQLIRMRSKTSFSQAT